MPRGMPNGQLYLHETIHIIGAGSEPYKRHTAAWAARRRHGGALVGIWQQSGSTGDWPRVINLWEMDGWDGWAAILERQYAGEGQPADLRVAPETRDWAEAARAWRTDFRETLLVPSRWCVMHPDWRPSARPPQLRARR